MKKELFRNFDTNRLVFEDMPEGGDAPAAAEGGDAPAADAPATCPNCGGEMTEGHTCPAPAADAPAEGGDAPAADAPAEPAEAGEGAAEGEGEHPAAPEAPATEAPKEEKKGFFASLFGKK